MAKTTIRTNAKTFKAEDCSKYDNSDEDVKANSKNQIHFKVDNNTGYQLIPRNDFYAYWGNFNNGPTTVDPWTKENAGHLISSRSPFTGSLGIIGFTIAGKNTVHAVLLGSNPYMSARSNWAYVKLSGREPRIDKDTLNELYDAETQSASIELDGKTLKIVASIGQADDTTATFRFTMT